MDLATGRREGSARAGKNDKAIRGEDELPMVSTWKDERLPRCAAGATWEDIIMGLSFVSLTVLMVRILRGTLWTFERVAHTCLKRRIREAVCLGRRVFF